MSSLKRKKNNSGQSLIEYLIIVSIIAIGSIAIVKTMGQTIYVRFANITGALQGSTGRNAYQPNAINPEQYKRKDLDDFFNEAR